MPQLIEPRLLKGFRDVLPDDEIARKSLEATLERTFRLHGFLPIDTPALEYADVLLGKGGGETDKQIYRFLDNGGRDVALRFDLTVPFARYMAGTARELPMPFRRYHMAKVWRGENTQRGRFREFMQCDFDVVGTDTASADFEILALIRECFEALGIGEVTIQLSHRGVFNRLLARLEIEDRKADILRIVDKLPKIGAEAVSSALGEVTSASHTDKILKFITKEADYESTLQKMESMSGGQSEESQRLRDMASFAAESGVEGLTLNPAITRGLDYYTGLVYETFLDRLPDIGSVCSGGRYNDLASLYTKRRIPGVGASIGLDRLLAALKEIGTGLQSDPVPQLLLFNLDAGLTGYYHRLARLFRREGYSAEVYPEARKLAQQFQYAEKRRIPVGVICGDEEKSGGVITLKNLLTRQSYDKISQEQGLEIIRSITAGA